MDEKYPDRYEEGLFANSRKTPWTISFLPSEDMDYDNYKSATCLFPVNIQDDRYDAKRCDFIPSPEICKLCLEAKKIWIMDMNLDKIAELLHDLQE
jgi:hypothetical protein